MASFLQRLSQTRLVVGAMLKNYLLLLLDELLLKIERFHILKFAKQHFYNCFVGSSARQTKSMKKFWSNIAAELENIETNLPLKMDMLSGAAESFIALISLSETLAKRSVTVATIFVSLLTEKKVNSGGYLLF